MDSARLRVSGAGEVEGAGGERGSWEGRESRGGKERRRDASRHMVPASSALEDGLEQCRAGREGREFEEVRWMRYRQRWRMSLSSAGLQVIGGGRLRKQELGRWQELREVAGVREVRTQGGQSTTLMERGIVRFMHSTAE